jgi:hypothetical protein
MGSFLGVLYLVTFMIVNAVILTNVVVAVLLEKVCAQRRHNPHTGAPPS